MAMTDKITGLAFLVSLLAIGLALMSSSQEIQYRKLSVVPMIKVSYVDGSDKEKTGIFLDSVGLGPARVINIQLFVDGKFIAEAYDDNQWINVLQKLSHTKPKLTLKSPLKFTSFSSDFYLPTGESIPLLYQQNEQLTDESLAFIRNAKKHLAFGICFCSLYLECWQLVSPGLKANSCDSPLARYLLLNKGPIATQLKSIPRVIEPWSPH